MLVAYCIHCLLASGNILNRCYNVGMLLYLLPLLVEMVFHLCLSRPIVRMRFYFFIFKNQLIQFSVCLQTTRVRFVFDEEALVRYFSAL